jgi:protein-S-isoprenylcysteine O-methyltransferase Ste14
LGLLANLSCSLAAGGDIDQALRLSRKPGATPALLYPLNRRIFLLIRGHRLLYPLSAPVIPRMEIVAWAGVVLCVAGLSFCIWARAILGRNWSGTVTLKEGHELIERGPYRLVRHPIYTGLLAMFLGTVVVLGHVAGIAGLVLVFVSFWIKLRDEERIMLKQFPDQYAAYQQRVKRIIPFVL